MKKKRLAWNAYMNAVRLNLSSRQQLYARYVRTRQKVTNKIRRMKRQHEHRLFINISQNPKLFYSYCNAKRVKPPIGEVKLPDGSLTTNHKMTACAFSDYFKNVFTNEDDVSDIYAGEFQPDPTGPGAGSTTASHYRCWGK